MKYLKKLSLNEDKDKEFAVTHHRITLSKGGDKFDYKNLAVCCYQCNQQKKNMDYDVWLQKINV